MSSTVIYLSNQVVEAVIGDFTGNRVKVTKACWGEAPEQSIVNGQITDPDAFAAFLKAFWEKNSLPTKNVHLVINSSRTVTRFFHVPKMGRQRLEEYLPREFADVERTKDPLYSYLRLEQTTSEELVAEPEKKGVDKKKQIKTHPEKAPKLKKVTKTRIFAASMERAFLQGHVEWFNSLGITLSSVEPALMAELYMLHQLSFLKDKICAVQLLDGSSLLNVLYADGHYVNHNRTRVFGEHGSTTFSVECARALGGLMQFAKANQITGQITDVYMGGMESEDYVNCQDAMNQMYDGLTVHQLSEEGGREVSFPADSDRGFGGFVSACGGLVSEKGTQNLMHAYNKNSEASKRRKMLIRMAVPFVAAAVGLAGFWVFEGFSWLWKLEQMSLIMDKMEAPGLMANSTKYDMLTTENQMLSARYQDTAKTWGNIQTYPVMSTKVDQVVAECAAGLVTAEVTSFQAEQGSITVNSSSASELSIHEFINRLTDRTDLFRDVVYTGFEYVEQDGAWKINVQCYLNQPEAETEAVVGPWDAESAGGEASGAGGAAVSDAGETGGAAADGQEVSAS